MTDRAPAASSHGAPRREIGSAGNADAGPTLVIVGGIHGNEPAGIEAARRVLARLREPDAPVLAGRLVALVGHLGAQAAAAREGGAGARLFDHDLNRLFTPGAERAAMLDAEGRLPGDEAVSREHRELVGILGAIDDALGSSPHGAAVLDLHTVSSASPPFIAMEDTLPSRALARHFPLPIVLGIEEELRGLMFDHVARTRRVVSMVVEGGQHDDPASVDILEATVWVAMHALGVLPCDRAPVREDPRAVLEAAAGPWARRVFDIRHLETILVPDFEIRPTIQSFHRVRRGRTVVATQAGSDVVAPANGLVFMPNRQPLKLVGDDGFFIVREVGRAWIRLSGWLRRREALHCALPLTLPGVRRRPGHEHHLLVAPEVASVLARGFFHLMGYRLLRAGPVRHLPPVPRAVAAALAFAGSIARVLGGALHPGREGKIGGEREQDWIVARRVLDTHPPTPNDAGARRWR